MAEMTFTLCPICGTGVPHGGGRGRPRTYCTPRCRKTAELKVRAGRRRAYWAAMWGVELPDAPDVPDQTELELPDQAELEDALEAPVPAAPPRDEIESALSIREEADTTPR